MVTLLLKLLSSFQKILALACATEFSHNSYLTSGSRIKRNGAPKLYVHISMQFQTFHRSVEYGLLFGGFCSMFENGMHPVHMVTCGSVLRLGGGHVLSSL